MALDITFKPGEHENVRRPKLNSIIAAVNAATAITTDPTIAAFAGLTGAADKLAYFNGVDTMALTDLPAFGRTLIANASAADARSDLALGSLAVLSSINDSNWSGADLEIANGGTGASSASAARNNLGLAIGTNVQAYAANLTTWAGITPGTGVGTFLATPLSANLAAAVTDETGTGSLVFATSPALVTPDIGAATASGILLSTVAAGQPNVQANQNTGAVANNGTYDFAAQTYGFFFIAETNATGQHALCATDGVNVRIIWQSAAGYTVTINNPGTMNLYYSGGTPRIQNKLGANAIFNIFNVKVA